MEGDLMARRIRAIINHFGDSQAEFAERIGLSRKSQSEVSKWTRGEGSPSLPVLRRIAGLVGADIAVFEREEDPFAMGVRFAVEAIANAYLRADTELVDFLGEEPEINLAFRNRRLPPDATLDPLSGNESATEQAR